MVLNEVRTVFAARSDHLVAFYDAFHHEVYRYLPRHLRDTSETLPRPGDEERRGGRAQGATLDATEVKEADTRPHRRVRSPGARCTRHCWGDEEVRREKGERRGMGGDGATASWTTTVPSRV